MIHLLRYVTFSSVFFSFLAEGVSAYASTLLVEREFVMVPRKLINSVRAPGWMGWLVLYRSTTQTYAHQGIRDVSSQPHDTGHSGQYRPFRPILATLSCPSGYNDPKLSYHMCELGWNAQFNIPLLKLAFELWDIKQTHKFGAIEILYT